MRQKKYILSEQELPTQWYNIQADMPNKPLPPLNPQTHQPMNADDLSHVFNKECSKQELDTEHAWIDIPEDVLEKYTFYRSTPLVRAYALEEALGTPAHIYFKNESINPLGSHKINSAIPQCYYCKQEGDTNRDWCRPVGCSPLLCSKTLRPGGSSLSGKDYHAAETIPFQYHAYVWSHCRGFSFHEYTRR